MLSIAFSRYYLTETRGGKTRRYASSWVMSEADAAARGLTAADIVPGTTELREVPETEEEKRRSLVNYQSAGIDSVKPPR